MTAMTYTYGDLIDDIQAIIGVVDDKHQRGRIARMIDVSFREVYNHLDFVDHPSVITFVTLTGTGTYTTLPDDMRRIVRILDSNGNEVHRSGETGGAYLEWEMHGQGQIKWLPWLKAQQEFELAYVAQQVLQSSETATVTFPDIAYNYLVWKSIAHLSRNYLYRMRVIPNLWFSEADKAWMEFRNRAWDESQVSRVFKNDRYVVGPYPRP